MTDTVGAGAEAGDATVEAVDVVEPADPERELLVAQGAVAGFAVQAADARDAVTRAEAARAKAQAALDGADLALSSAQAAVGPIDAQLADAQAHLDSLGGA